MVIHTVKKHHVYLEWICTEGRAKKVIEYVKNQLEHTDEIEIWHIWMGMEVPAGQRTRKGTL